MFKKMSWETHYFVYKLVPKSKYKYAGACAGQASASTLVRVLEYLEQREPQAKGHFAGRQVGQMRNGGLRASVQRNLRAQARRKGGRRARGPTQHKQNRDELLHVASAFCVPANSVEGLLPAAGLQMTRSGRRPLAGSGDVGDEPSHLRGDSTPRQSPAKQGLPATAEDGNVADLLPARNCAEQPLAQSGGVARRDGDRHGA